MSEANHPTPETICTCGLGPARPEDHPSHCAAFRPSNVQSLLEDLRNDDRVSMQHTAWLEERAVTEIERLTRELEEGRKYSVERGNLLGAVSHQGAEIQRLRAALERIAKDEPDHLAHEVARRALSGEPSPDETSGCVACDRGVLTPHDVETAAEPIAPGMVDGVRHAMWCACLHTPAGQAMRRPCSCGTLEKTAAHLPGDGTRRAAFDEWWQMMWKDNDPRSSPGFDEQMRSWTLDAWQAGAAHERDRIAAMRSAENGEAKL